MKNILATTLSMTLLLTVPAGTALAGAGHDHGESQLAGGSYSNSFTLEQSTIDNLGIKTDMAKIAPMKQSINMLSQIKLLPEKQLIVTPRFEGKVEKIHARLGDKITKGQELVKIDPLAVGSGKVTIKSAIDGVLSSQNIVIGQVVKSGDIMMEVTDRNEVFAKAITYDISQTSKIRSGQKAKLYIDSMPERIFEGEIEIIDQSIDEESRTFSVYALVDNKDNILIPHMQGMLEIFLDNGNNLPVLSVPKKAVLGTVGQKFIYVRDGNYFEKRNVTIGKKKGNRQEIIEGVFPGEEVVIQGNYQLQYVTPEGQDDKTDDHGHAH